MANGYSMEQMIELILENQREFRVSVREMDEKLDNITAHGCAHRADDLRRVESLEDWKNRGILGVITTLIISIGSLLAMLFSPHK